MLGKGKILAIDYGKGSFGLAVCDEGRQMVFGRGVMKNKKGLSFLLEQLNTFCVQEGVVEIVVGLPLGIEGQDTEQTKRIRHFAEKLKDKVNLPVSFQDESFTSFEAGQMLKELGVHPQNRKQDEDELAAVLILQRYLSQL